MSWSHKQDVIRAFFDDFAGKIDRLKETDQKGFKDEASTLCVVYMDRLASGYYESEPGRSAEVFCQTLRELGGNPLLGMIHPKELLERTQERLPAAAALVGSLVRRQPSALLSEGELAQDITSSSLAESEKQNLISNLWRASMANICYQYIRNSLIQDLGSIGFTFDGTTLDRKKGARLDFEVLYDALHKIWERVRDTSIRTGDWFGRTG